MPQMKPMNWLILMFYFFMFFMIVIVKVFFQKLFMNMNKKNVFVKKMSFLFKW
uniref:ATP synthase F0 subunit 8 n=1 Tax=Tessmannella kiplingi TaxID=2943473 RepID=A0A9E8K0W3_9HYME|nr:ATP synthase F0 subunit 8 [Tessmannella kiplingi]